MPKHLQREIESLKKLFTKYSGLVEKNVNNAIESVINLDGDLASEVIEADGQIDQMEVLVEEECLKILALHQPVAIDLRFITAILRINNDLERVGDIAVYIARRTKYLIRKPIPYTLPKKFKIAAVKAQIMLKSSLDSLMQLDVNLAKEICEIDDEIDILCNEIYNIIKVMLQKHPEDVDSICNLLVLPSRVERIADHATNIAEDVIYMVNGEIIRHIK
jgi:phosphate transport system protein